MKPLTKKQIRHVKQWIASDGDVGWVCHTLPNRFEKAYIDYLKQHKSEKKTQKLCNEIEGAMTELFNKPSTIASYPTPGLSWDGFSDFEVPAEFVDIAKTMIFVLRRSGIIDNNTNVNIKAR